MPCAELALATRLPSRSGMAAPRRLRPSLAEIKLLPKRRANPFFLPFSLIAYLIECPTHPNALPAPREDVADALAFALRFQGRKRVHNADEIMAEIVAKRVWRWR